jgi:glucokinase
LLRVKALISKKSNKADVSKPVESIEDDVQAWLDNIKSKQPKKSALAIAGPSKSQSTSKSPTSAPKNAKKSGSKVNSRSKA